MLANKLECTGCMSCVNSCTQNCINIVKDQYGFLYPEIDERRCIKCGKCNRSCPIIIDVFGYKQFLERPEVYAAWYGKGRENE